ncbi:MAG: tRNA preQ1(34) S-adenosylmethionine ribosyltransferase-isomerase QueA [Deltaproteobacteria bacterium]|nr:tRNA preQ1(34) S-adenosylmethionine ribosyltransferase-isomerase QueA [Deltaproteobacteria bacterium]
MLASRALFSPSDYTFDLPTELIAQVPAPTRDASRLLHLRGDGSVSDAHVTDLVELLPADAVLVVNDTRVIPARVLGQKASGGKVELLFLEPEPAHGPNAWRCLARARRPLKPGQIVEVPGASIELVTAREGEEGSVVVRVPGDVYALLDRIGHIPLPRYVQREDTAADRERYQTIFAKHPGAVAAPTAGLHVTPAIADALRAKGIAITPITLHVGYGTFEPIRADDIRQHHMHRERYTIPDETARLVASGRPIVALGTTALRALEASRGKASSGTTDLFIYPGSGHSFVVQHLITNFHLPESTLLMLVCAFAGTERVLAAYRHAVAQRYRFFSYGDAMLVHRC